MCFTTTLAETHNKLHPVQSPLYRTELPTQAIQERSRNFNTDEEWTQSLQYNHFYTNEYKSNKKGYRRLSLDDQISEELSQSNDSSSSSSRKQFLMKNFYWSLITRLTGAFALFEISNFHAQKMCKMIFVSFKVFAPAFIDNYHFKNSVDWFFK